ncbi:MAG: hypothetical protein R6U10_07685 [Thermoplasmatota archaeon]
MLLCLPPSAAMDSGCGRPAEEVTAGGDDVEVFIEGSLPLIDEYDEIISFKVTVVNHREEEASGYLTYAVPLFRESQFEENKSFEVHPSQTYTYAFVAGSFWTFTFLKVTVKVDNITVIRMGVMVMGFTVFFTPTMETGSAGSTSSPTNPCMGGTTGTPHCIARS